MNVFVIYDTVEDKIKVTPSGKVSWPKVGHAKLACLEHFIPWEPRRPPFDNQTRYQIRAAELRIK